MTPPDRKFVWTEEDVTITPRPPPDPEAEPQ
jgi:hypothetical protein